MRRGIPRVLALALLGALMLAAAGCQSSAKKHLYAAEDLFEKRDLKGAQAELREAVKEDPNLADAHKSLAHVDEYLGDTDEAGKEFMAASALDPTDQKIMAKARYYRYLQQLSQQADKALDAVKAGDTEQGMKDLKAALQDTKSKASRDHVSNDIKQAIPILVQKGDQLAAQKKYVDAEKAYEDAIHGYVYVAQAENKQSLDPAADQVMHKANEAAKEGHAPDMMFRLLNDIIAFDPDNKSANIELAQVYLRRSPPDYGTAADLMERAGAPDNEVKKLRAEAKRNR
jgi:tetratricopeptide (TPR) repeat protein